MNIFKGLFAVVVVALVVACSDQKAETVQLEGDETETILREVNFTEVSRGGKLFTQNCAECHGAGGEGASNWRQRDAGGMFPAPPLNGTGHAWHHPEKMLRHVIKNGSPGGQGGMKGWKDKLSDEEISAVIAWFQSQWSDEVYAVWYQMDRRSQSGS